jgi:hypothetical protein
MISGLSVTIDASGLNAAIAAAQVYSKRTPAVAVNTAAYVVAKFAWSKMPVTNIGRIDSELGVIVTPIVPTMGVRKGSTNITMSWGIRGESSPRSLAMMIAIARMHPGSKYSQLTGNYWPVEKPATKGVIAFLNFMEQVAERMVKARHSSTHFIQSCWIPAIRDMEPFADRSAVRGRAAAAGPRGSDKFVPDSGSGVPATEGAIYAVAEITNAAGVKGHNDVLDRKHNEALWLYGGPALQEAMDDEARNVMEYVNDHEFERAFGPLRAKGFVVSV